MLRSATIHLVDLAGTRPAFTEPLRHSAESLLHCLFYYNALVMYACACAGSERISASGAEGMTRTEAININKSLTVLGNAIKALVDHSAGKNVVGEHV